MNTKVVAIDFDGTLCQLGKYPMVGEDVPHAWETVKRLIASGHKIIIWTVRDNPIPVMNRLEKHGLNTHDSITMNFKPHQQDYSMSPKVDADLYIDDKALGCPLIDTATNSYVDWYHVEHLLDMKGYFNAIILGA